MDATSFVLKGNVCYSVSPQEASCTAGGYLVCVEGKSAGVFAELPVRFASLPVIDCGDQLIVPGMSDIHVHAPQYAFRGLGMDLELIDWLNTRTFPEEARYADLAYAERAAAVPKCPGLPPGSFVPINCESGNFLHFPRSLFDVRYESASGNGRGVWERCISGVNLGALGTLILHGAAEEGLFSAGLRANLLSRTFTNIELDDFGSGRRPDLIYCSADEARILRGLLLPLYERAAIFSAINIAAAALAAARAQGRRSGVVRVNADGSTFWKTASVPFVDIVRKTLGRLLAPRGLDFELLRIDDAPLVGAALAAAH